jgi:hypothetical protein
MTWIQSITLTLLILLGGYIYHNSKPPEINTTCVVIEFKSPYGYYSYTYYDFRSPDVVYDYQDGIVGKDISADGFNISTSGSVLNTNGSTGILIETNRRAVKCVR